MGDWPEWRFLSDDGRETTWTTEGDHTRYVTDLRARIRVARVRWKADSQMVRKLDRDPASYPSPAGSASLGLDGRASW